jgi:hypothetical protein
MTFTNKTMTSTTNNVIARGFHSATTVVDISGSAAPSIGQVLFALNSTTAAWATPNYNNFLPYGDMVSSETNTTTTSNSYTVASGMTITPPSGKYLVIFTSTVKSNAYNKSITCKIYIDNVAVGAAIASYVTSPAQTLTNVCIATGTVDGSQTIQGRWFTSAGTATMLGRTLAIIQIRD